LPGGILEDKLGDRFSCGVLVQQKTRLSRFLEPLRQRIIVAQEHAMIERLINPALHDTLDIAEIDHHAQGIKAFRRQVDGDFAIMAMRHATLPLIVHQPVAVAEVEIFRNFVHDRPYLL
jgi:hypothetical protein